MNQDALKALVGRAAVAHLAQWPAAARAQPGLLIGVGTGSTVNCFIDALGAAMASEGLRIAGAVSSSLASSARLAALGVPLREANDVQALDVYVDGADEIDPRGCMIKGGGAALTREKIVADLAAQFLCIVDASKQVAVLGHFPLPVEVIPMARAQVIRRFEAMPGVTAAWRAGVVTDNGNGIVDVRGLHLIDPLASEAEFSQWPGVVTVGIFARNRASLALVGAANGVNSVAFG